jgi:hypothetical protein
MVTEKQLHIWIKKNLHIKSVKENIRPGIIVLNKVKLYWDIPFYIREDHCYFKGPVLISNSVIILKTFNSTVKLYFNNEKNDKVYFEKNIEFIGPPINNLITYTELEGITIITNIVWENIKSAKYNINEYETIKCAKMIIKVS